MFYSKALAVLTATHAVQAATITHRVDGVGSVYEPVSPYFCIQDTNGQVTYSLAYGESVDGNKYSGDPYYVSGALRFGGCDYDDSYLGYLGVSIGGGQNSLTYSAPEGVHITYANPQIDSEGTLTGAIEYTQIEPNFDLPNPSSSNKTWPYFGINLSGFEFDKIINPTTAPNLSQADEATSYSDLADTTAFIQTGANTIRMPLHWGYLQPDGPGQGDIYLNYYNSYIKPMIQSTTNAKVHTIIDLHAYMRYSEFGEQYAGCSGYGPCPDGTLITDSTAYIDVWTKLYALMKNDPDIDMSYIMLDLMNEPVEVPNDMVFTIQRDIILALREAGFEGPILVEGNCWSGLHSWSECSWQGDDGKTYTNANLFTRENFEKAGITDLSKIIINAHQYFDSDYSGTGSSCQTDLSTTGSNGFNLEAFVNYLKEQQMTAMVTEFGAGQDASTCTQALTQFMNYLEENAATDDAQYGFVGGTVWSTGHGWGGYNLRVEPDSYHWDVISSYLNPSQTQEDHLTHLHEVNSQSTEKKTEPPVVSSYLSKTGLFNASATRKSINVPANGDSLSPRLK